MECQNGQGVQNLARDENHGCPRLRRIEQGELMGVQDSQDFSIADTRCKSWVSRNAVPAIGRWVSRDDGQDFA